MTQSARYISNTVIAVLFAFSLFVGANLYSQAYYSNGSGATGNVPSGYGVSPINNTGTNTASGLPRTSSVPASQSGYPAPSGYAAPAAPAVPAVPATVQPGAYAPVAPSTPAVRPTPGSFNVPTSQQGQVLPSQVAPPASAPITQINAPFHLTAQQQEQVNRVLTFWESYTQGIKKFEANFDLYTYPAVSLGGADANTAPQPRQSSGFLKYESPNKGVFRIDGQPKELYRCNGKSVYTYNFDKKEINEYKYDDGNGQELNKGPMAFLFGASAATLRDRYWIRLLAPPPGAPKGQIWLEAYPKYQEDLQDMTKAELIINVQPCKPVAFQRYAPNGDRQSYALKNIKVNKFELFGGEPFEPNERGWTLVTSEQQE